MRKTVSSDRTGFTMGNKYRQLSEADIYHVTIRGVAKQIIFEDDVDRRYFGERMRAFLEEEDVELFAWCFMSNHVHLLLHGGIENVSKLMKKLQISYAAYFNARHDRVGHLFQGRFDSVPVESDEQLMTTVRYIHDNPMSIPDESFERYKWSSYREYLGTPFISETDFVASLFSSKDEFASFHESWKPEPDEPQKPTKKRLTDDEAIEFAQNELGIASITSVSSLEKANRNARLAALRRAGLPIDQIARITGIGRNIVQRAGK